ncbi:hypothetical protein ES705_31090 [subsurface metagenome]
MDFFGMDRYFFFRNGNFFGLVIEGFYLFNIRSNADNLFDILFDLELELV